MIIKSQFSSIFLAFFSVFPLKFSPPGPEFMRIGSGSTALIHTFPCLSTGTIPVPSLGPPLLFPGPHSVLPWPPLYSSLAPLCFSLAPLYTILSGRPLCSSLAFLCSSLSPLLFFTGPPLFFPGPLYSFLALLCSSLALLCSSPVHTFHSLSTGIILVPFLLRNFFPLFT